MSGVAAHSPLLGPVLVRSAEVPRVYWARHRIMEWNMRPHSLLPLQQFDRLFLTDAGLETDIIFNRGIDLPLFASISLLRTERGRQALKDYFRPYLKLAVQHGVGLDRKSTRLNSSH